MLRPSSPGGTGERRGTLGGCRSERDGKGGQSPGPAYSGTIRADRKARFGSAAKRGFRRRLLRYYGLLLPKWITRAAAAVRRFLAYGKSPLKEVGQLHSCRLTSLRDHSCRLYRADAEHRTPAPVR
ncbi:hypothetical protein MTO96_022778 [Rhipicephalus appendiculatus]